MNWRRGAPSSPRSVVRQGLGQSGPGGSPALPRWSGVRSGRRLSRRVSTLGACRPARSSSRSASTRAGHRPADQGAAGGGAAQGGLQPLRPARRRGHHRPADRLRHRCDVGAAVGRDDDGRRVLRRQPVLLPAAGDGAGHHRLRRGHPHPPGTGCRADPLRDGGGGRRRRPQQHPLRHHEGQHRAPAGRGPRPRHRRGAGPGGGPPVQGQHGPRRPAGHDRGGGRRGGAVRHGHRHQQQRRRPAGVDGEPARCAGRVRRARAAPHPRRLPLRRERLVHPDPRTGLRRPLTGRDRQGDVLPRRRVHDVGEEGRPRQHRGVPRHERRRSWRRGAGTC